jgi:DNA polymerase-3 subunit gamma/tau
MNYIVSALKYRPKKFEEVVGQQAVTNTLKNAIAKDHLAQALLFTGPRGVGKTTCARILAKEINKAEGLSADEDFAFNIFELDAASNNSVDDIRNLIEQVRIPPQVGKYKVYIIDEVHMLSTQAFNAFLKTLEEPPAHAVFILATTEKHKIIPTILSRCQIYDFKRISAFDIKEHLKSIVDKEGLEAEEDALFLIAQKADGALRDALSMFDKVVSYSDGKITRKIVSESMSILDYDAYFTVVDLMINNDVPGILNYFNDLLQQGFDAHQFIAGLSGHLRDLLVAKEPATVDLLEVSDNIKEKYKQQAKDIDMVFLMRALNLTVKTDIDYKLSKSPHLLVELTLMKLASLQTDEAKKKIDKILPASLFRNTVSVVEAFSEKEKNYPENTRKNVENRVEEPIRESKNSPVDNQKVGLSLKKLRQKKQELLEESLLQAGKKLPTEPFSQAAFDVQWRKYLEILRKQHEKNMHSILTIDKKPKVVGSKIHLTLSSNALKTELERNKEKVLNYLRRHLNNYDIDFVIDVKEEIQNEFVYTKKDKFNKLLEKYPDLQFVKDKFKLDL